MLLDENRPGSRLIDGHLDRKIYIDVDAPKKGTSAFDTWAKGDLLPGIAQADEDKRGIAVFTDGSQKKDRRSPRPYPAQFGNIKVKTGISSLVKCSDAHGAAQLDFGLTGDGVTIFVKSRR